MRIKLIQDVIDSLSQKECRENYNGILNTLLWIEENVDKDIPKDLINKIKKHRKYMPCIHYKEDVKETEEYLKTIDVNTLPEANKELRDHQLKLADFAYGLVYDIENAIDIHFLLTGGSLIGALRNNKFIPWDDDIDFDLMRDEFEQLIDYAKKHYIYFNAYNCSSYNEHMYNINKLLQEHPNKVIFSQKPSCLTAYKGTSLEDSICIDILPRDYINPDLTEEQYYKYRESFENILLKKDFKSFFDCYKKELCNEKVYKKESNLTAYGWGNISFITKKLSVLKIEDVKPFKRILFEGKQFYTINNIEGYLQNFYGDYTKFPLQISITTYKQTFKNWKKKHSNKENWH